jgi:predicted RNase H-like nuclease
VIVLGIDAAWTAGQPSGVALVRRSGRRWRCLALAPSYAAFVDGAVDWRARPAAGVPDPDALLAACVRLAGAPPDAIAIDMPLATHAITARRAADNAIASAYARHGLGAHSPSAERPGAIADALRAGFAAHGYALAVAGAPAPRRALLEVFPHAALVALLGADYRIPYKLARAAQYWPERTPAARRRAIVARWRHIRRALEAHVDGIALRIPARGPLAQLKRFEDALDAAVCAWVGTEYLAGRTQPYGDATAAVWAHPVVSPRA